MTTTSKGLLRILGCDSNASTANFKRLEHMSQLDTTADSSKVEMTAVIDAPVSVARHDLVKTAESVAERKEPMTRVAKWRDNLKQAKVKRDRENADMLDVLVEDVLKRMDEKTALCEHELVFVMCNHDTTAEWNGKNKLYSYGKLLNEAFVSSMMLDSGATLLKALNTKIGIGVKITMKKYVSNMTRGERQSQHQTWKCSDGSSVCWIDVTSL